MERLLAKYGGSLRYVGSFQVDEKVAQSTGTQFPCSFCDLKFASKDIVLSHQRKVHADRLPFTCDCCNAKFTDINSINAHYRQSHGVARKTRCVICNGCYSSVNLHCRKAHNVEFPAAGLVAGLLGSEVGNSVDSFLKHQTDGFSEEKVSQETREQKNLLEEIRAKYMKLRDARFECLSCCLTFGTKGGLLTHRRRHHRGIVFYRWECNICSRIIDKCTTSKKKAHLARHAGKKAFACKHCGESFPQVVDLRSHIKTIHRRKRPKKPCDICGKGFGQKTVWQHRKEEHPNRLSTECNWCGKVLKSRRSLREHKRLYCKTLTNAPVLPPRRKTCSCVDCGKAFECKAHLARHQNSVPAHPGDTFECKACYKTFPRLSCLRYHKYLHNAAKGIVSQKIARCRFCNRQFSRSAANLLQHRCPGRVQFQKELAERRLQKSLNAMVTTDVEGHDTKQTGCGVNADSLDSVLDDEKELVVGIPEEVNEMKLQIEEFDVVQIDDPGDIEIERQVVVKQELNALLGM